jgi:hypothetical protein
MPIAKPTSPLKATTQSFIEIEDIQEDVVLMKDNSAVVVIEVGAVNFWLLSAEEQSSMIYSYASLLNSLSFPVQVLILSKRMDISSYLEYLSLKVKNQHNDVMKKRLVAYQDFIKNIVKKTTVLERRFFFAIPFSPLEMGATGAGAGKRLRKEYVISRAKTSLYPKRDTLIRLLTKIGLKATDMQQQQLVELFYNLYNVSPTGRPLAPIQSYTDTVMTT